MKSIVTAAAFAIVAMSGVNGARANPAGFLDGLKNANSIVQQTGWHRHRKCWWRHGHRHCPWW